MNKKKHNFFCLFKILAGENWEGGNAGNVMKKAREKGIKTKQRALLFKKRDF